MPALCRSQGTTLILKMLAPWVAVILFWCVFKNAWLALLAYHLQIVLWNHLHFRQVFFGFSVKSFVLFSLPAILAGPAMYFLLPAITEINVAQWLADYGLTGWGLLLMVPYFGLIHPLLEQVHWAPLREKTPLAHVVFAGYHVLVLSTLLPISWLVIGFVFLAFVSVCWQRMADSRGGLAIPCCSHMLADSGIVMAAYGLSCL
ncbi:hypothetical protein QSV34_02405 [Porticoccus sp. W117]|uniref:hypothetical protein n=1 Tax=Porticoccus sp. W117 TaxID=3054777 RepID=UPI0025950BF7|nr:hypothetical protein [Porticoccus sp. W117]MDM3870202.1 hypothetical protein [Porticoccus sp. W117]